MQAILPTGKTKSQPKYVEVIEAKVIEESFDIFLLTKRDRQLRYYIGGLTQENLYLVKIINRILYQKVMEHKPLNIFAILEKLRKDEYSNLIRTIGEAHLNYVAYQYFDANHGYIQRGLQQTEVKVEPLFMDFINDLSA